MSSSCAKEKERIRSTGQFEPGLRELPSWKRLEELIGSVAALDDLSIVGASLLNW